MQLEEKLLTGCDNECEVRFKSRSENESFARIAVIGFMYVLNPTLEEVSDVKTAVSEAVTNCIIHGYEGDENGIIRMKMKLLYSQNSSGILELEISDDGIGIENVSMAMEPMYTTKPDEERSGMGFAFMEAFMDELRVVSVPMMGTRVYMKKIIG